MEVTREKAQPLAEESSVYRLDSYYTPQRSFDTAVPAAFIPQRRFQGEDISRDMATHAPNQSISSTEGQNNNTMPLNAYANKHSSDISSLSSGFGDGDIIIPATGTYSTLAPPPRVRQRETMYTEASEDAPPRFRTVNSWVRQQAGRVKRVVAPGGPEPEPEFGLMMPDGEEPRRAADMQYRLAR